MARPSDGPVALELPALASLLQLSDSAFPSGAFTGSWGMEALTQRGLVADRADLVANLALALQGVTGRVEAPTVVRAYRAAEQSDCAALRRLNPLLDCYAPVAAARETSRRVGRRFLQAAITLHPELASALAPLATPVAGVHPAVAWGAVGAALGLPPLAAVSAYLNGWRFQQAQAAARLIPLGQNDVLLALRDLREPLAAAAAAALDGRVRPPAAAPLADVSRFVQPALERRLFVC